MGANLLTDVLLRKLFAKSNLLVQLVVPALLKNYSTHAIAGLEKKLTNGRHNGSSKNFEFGEF
jgi:hypothetical protein